MSQQLLSEIAHVRSLKKELRDTVLPLAVQESIGLIHESIRTGSDSQGWSRVGWRTGGGGGSGGGGGGGGGGHSWRGGGKGNTHRSPFGNGSSSNNQQPLPSHHEKEGRERHSQQSRWNNSTSFTVNRTGSSGGGPPSGGHIPIRYVSKFKSSDTEKVDDAILNTLIRGKLNKFSAANYDDIKDFMCQILDSGKTDFLKHFMLLVFQKAATEEFFCPLYARLLSELSSKYEILIGEMSLLFNEYINIFKEVDETSVSDYDEFVKRNSEKKYRLGYSQFLAELIKLNVIEADMFLKTLSLIMEQIEATALKDDYARVMEEYADCIMRMMKAFDKDTELRSTIKARFLERLSHVTVRNPDYKSLSNKARFTFLDAYETIDRF